MQKEFQLIIIDEHICKKLVDIINKNKLINVVYKTKYLLLKE